MKTRKMWVCKCCGTPVRRKGTHWFHIVMWHGRPFPFLETIAREAERRDVEQAKAAGVTQPKPPPRPVVTTTRGL